MRQTVLFSTNFFYIHFLFNFILVTILLLKKCSSDDNHGDMAASVSEYVKGVIGTDDECENEFEHFIIDIGSYDDEDTSDGYYPFDSDDDDHNDRLSDGYDEDDEDDNGSYDEIGWDEDEEELKEEYNDFDLERRAEEFIAKVVDGWKEERYREL